MSSSLCETYIQSLLKRYTRMKLANLRDVRRSWLYHGDEPPNMAESMLGSIVFKSWKRCLQSGLEAYQKSIPENILSGHILQSRIDQRNDLITLAKPTMNYLHALMSGCGGVVLLSDHQGVIVHSVGDAEFINKADRVLLKTGASWLEKHRGTNAIGTALIEGRAVAINGSEHYLENNSFLSCAAAPIYQPNGRISGVLDISTDKNAYHPHTIGLIKATVHSLEKQLFHAHDDEYRVILKVHPNAEGLGSIAEGLVGLNDEGLIIGCDRAALSYLGIAPIDIGSVKLQQIVDISLNRVFDQAKHGPQPQQLRTHTDRTLFLSFTISDYYRHSHPTTTLDTLPIEAPAISEVTPAENLVEFGRLRELSKLAIEKTLVKTNGNISLAAKMLGISRNTLYRYLRND